MNRKYQDWVSLYQKSYQQDRNQQLFLDFVKFGQFIKQLIYDILIKQLKSIKVYSKQKSINYYQYLTQSGLKRQNFRINAILKQQIQRVFTNTKPFVQALQKIIKPPYQTSTLDLQITKNYQQYVKQYLKSVRRSIVNTFDNLQNIQNIKQKVFNSKKSKISSWILDKPQFKLPSQPLTFLTSKNKFKPFKRIKHHQQIQKRVFYNSDQQGVRRSQRIKQIHKKLNHQQKVQQPQKNQAVKPQQQVQLPKPQPKPQPKESQQDKKKKAQQYRKKRSQNFRKLKQQKQKKLVVQVQQPQIIQQLIDNQGNPTTQQALRKKQQQFKNKRRQALKKKKLQFQAKVLLRKQQQQQQQFQKNRKIKKIIQPQQKPQQKKQQQLILQQYLINQTNYQKATQQLQIYIDQQQRRKKNKKVFIQIGQDGRRKIKRNVKQQSGLTKKILSWTKKKIKKQVINAWNDDSRAKKQRGPIAGRLRQRTQKINYDILNPYKVQLSRIQKAIQTYTKQIMFGQQQQPQPQIQFMIQQLKKQKQQVQYNMIQQQRKDLQSYLQQQQNQNYYPPQLAVQIPQQITKIQDQNWARYQQIKTHHVDNLKPQYLNPQIRLQNEMQSLLIQRKRIDQQIKSVQQNKQINQKHRQKRLDQLFQRQLQNIKQKNRVQKQQQLIQNYTRLNQITQPRQQYINLVNQQKQKFQNIQTVIQTFQNNFQQNQYDYQVRWDDNRYTTQQYINYQQPQIVETQAQVDNQLNDKQKYDPLQKKQIRQLQLINDKAQLRIDRRQYQVNKLKSQARKNIQQVIDMPGYYLFKAQQRRIQTQKKQKQKKLKLKRNIIQRIKTYFSQWIGDTTWPLDKLEQQQQIKLPTKKQIFQLLKQTPYKPKQIQYQKITFIRGLINNQKTLRQRRRKQFNTLKLLSTKQQQAVEIFKLIDGDQYYSAPKVNCLFQGLLKYNPYIPARSYTKARSSLRHQQTATGWQIDIQQDKFMSDLQTFITDTQRYKHSQQLNKKSLLSQLRGYSIKNGQRKQQQNGRQLNFWDLVWKFSINLSYRLYQYYIFMAFIALSQNQFNFDLYQLVKLNFQKGVNYKWHFHSTVFNQNFPNLQNLTIDALLLNDQQSFDQRRQKIKQYLNIKYQFFSYKRQIHGGDYSNTQITVYLNSLKIFNDSQKAIKSKFQFIQRVYNLSNHAGVRYKNFKILDFGVSYNTKVTSVFCQLSQFGPNVFTISNVLVFLYFWFMHIQITQKFTDQGYKPWYLFGKQTYKQIDQYKQFIRNHHIQQDQWYSNCWGKIIAFLVYKKFGQFQIQIQNYRDLGAKFKFGKLNQAILMLKKLFNVGIIMPISSQKNHILQNQYHIYISSSHILIMDWQTTKKRFLNLSQKQKNTDISIQGMAKRNINTQYFQRILVPQNQYAKYQYFQQVFSAHCPQKQYLKFNQQRQIFFRRNTIYFDIQCTTGNQVYQRPFFVHIVCYGDTPIQQFQYSIRQFYDQQYIPKQIVNCIIAYVQRFNITPQKPLTVWYFNGHRYQMTYILKPLLQYFNQFISFGRPSQTKGYVIKQGAIHIKDILLLHTPNSLQKLSSSYNKIYKKQKQLIDIRGIWNPTVAQQNIQAIAKYCQFDVYATIQLVQRTFIQYHNLSKQMALYTKTTPVSLKCLYSILTASGISFFLMIHHFFKNPIRDNQPYKWKKLQRIHYKGGVTQIFKFHYQGNMVIIDINSSYPFSMKFALPWWFLKNLLPFQIQQCNKDKSKIKPLGFYQLQWFDFQGSVPIIPVTSQDGLIYFDRWHQNFSGSVYVWGCTLLQTPVKYKIKSGCQYTNINPQTGQQVYYTKQYVDFLYQKKKNTCKKTQSAKYGTLKVGLNSPYGKFGQRQFNHFSLYKQNQYTFENSDQVFYFSQKSWGMLRQQQIKTKQYVGDYVRIASFITAKSRAHLGKVGNRLGVQNIIYADTDSYLVKTQALQKIKDLLDQDQLGKWKVEKQVQKAVFLAPKCGILKSRQVGKKDFQWQYKWKGINKQILEENQDAQQLFQHFKKQLFRIYLSNKSLLFLNTIQFQRVLLSKRWTRAKGKVKIQRYFRSTNFKVKKQITRQLQAKPFRI